MSDDIMRKENIDPAKQKEMSDRLGCVFCDDGDYAEMSMELHNYTEKTSPIPDVEFGFFHGDISLLRAAVAKVDEDWVQYFGKDSSVFCGYVNGWPVSFCIVDIDADCIISSPDSRIASIGCVGTIPDYRKQGIGLRMVDLATVYAKSKGCTKGYIHFTHIDQWYAKLGYETFARFSIKQI
ncbi:MAG: GNAT family N-acetyltransferase [Huintestinicola sp.]